MHKQLAPRPHGFIDYALVLFFVLAPSLFGYGDDDRAALTSYIVAAAHLGLSVLTAYPLGLVKLIPFPIHGRMELVIAFVLVALPWIVGFSENDAARNVFIASGVATLAVYLLTDYRTSDIGTTWGRGRPATR
ncbi:MAG TPA: hypothetical protein VEL07_20070 [Planctomycetota bacterium]|nr:hypothetical protein [Planctomycetota bacterium]